MTIPLGFYQTLVGQVFYKILLGSKFEVIEEGLNGRTTNLDSPDKEGKNGAAYLFPCLESQEPIDLVILQLGKNDLKVKYKSTPESVIKGVEECLDIVSKEARSSNGGAPRIILLPILIIEEKKRLRSGKMENDFLGAHEKSVKLVSMYKELAFKHGIEFLDINKVAGVSSIDGVHIDAESHRVIGKFIADYISLI